MGYQWISRFLANDLVCCDTVMDPFAREILARLAETGPSTSSGANPADPRPDQGLRSPPDPDAERGWGERALPLAWRVEETEGAIGFATQQELLAVVADWLPTGQAVILLADRFYGTPEMIRWCQDRGWDYRLRLKGNLLARWGATKTTTDALALSGGHYFEAVALTGKRVTTNIGIIRGPGHAEPWIIAMSAKPGYLTTLGYTARWGIEPMFSDFNRAGLASNRPICAIPTVSPPELVEGLILVMSLALYWAVSTGMWNQANHPIPAEPHRTVSLPSSPAEGSPGSRGASGAPSNSSSNASHSLPLPKLWECLLN
jgi:hypothetical protein